MPSALKKKLTTLSKLGAYTGVQISGIRKRDHGLSC